MKLEHPTIVTKNKKKFIQPEHLTEFEQILIAKMFMQCFPQRDKLSLVANLHRHTISNAIEKWIPLWGTFGSYISMLPMPHDYFAKELPNDYVLHNLPNVTHLFDGKDIVIECVRKDNNLKRRIWSDKVHDSSCRTINFTTPMGLSFEHTRAVVARPSEQN